MTSGWVQVFDQSFQRVPISQYGAAHAAGFRVMAGYAGGGSESKWLTRAEIDAWLALPDTGIAALFEIGNADAINHPELGTSQAMAARAAWRALGYPDSAAISPAVDVNVSPVQAQAGGVLTRYLQAWKQADVSLPIAYVEADAGALLKAEGLTRGTFTPAAYAWNVPAVLYTPANAPSHVVWTQEHNGQNRFGGNIDVGNIRTSAPIWWANSANGNPDVPVTPEEDMPLTKDDIALLLGSSVNDSGLTVAMALQSATASAQLNTVLGSSGPNVGVAVQSTYQMVKAMQAALDPAVLGPIVTQAVQLAGENVDEATLQAALVGALKELAANVAAEPS